MNQPMYRRTHVRIYIYVLFMENRATESDRQSRQGACAAFRGWVTNLSTYANQSSNPRRYVVIMANPRLHCSHLSPGIILESPSPPSFPLVTRYAHTNSRSDITRDDKYARIYRPTSIPSMILNKWIFAYAFQLSSYIWIGSSIQIKWERGKNYLCNNWWRGGVR